MNVQVFSISITNNTSFVNENQEKKISKSVAKKIAIDNLKMLLGIEEMENKDFLELFKVEVKEIK